MEKATPVPIRTLDAMQGSGVFRSYPVLRDI
jgi:hypothetical protein